MTISKDELKTAIKYVSQDVYDDFWPDVIGYADYFENTDWCNDYDFSNYQPHESNYIDVPKPTLILRPGHFLELPDRIYYQLLINKFALDVDNQFESREVNCGYRISNKLSKLFHDNIESWKRFRGQDAALFAENNEGLLLKTDISAYFEHIKIEKLTEALSRYGIDGKNLQKLEDLLMYWSEDGIGIPQGNGCSSFLANAYLDEVDKAMIVEGYRYYRFVDDIRIFADDEQTLRQAIQRLTQLFRPLNLHLNSGKTKIINYKKHQQDLNKHQDLMDSINYVLNFEIFPDTELLDESLQEIWKDTITDKRIDKTRFRYCVGRFRAIKSDFPLNDILANNLYDPSNIDMVSNYLREYINEKKVQNVVIQKFLSSEYEYELIYLLKLLLNADSLHFELGKIQKSKVYSTANFLLIGYYLMVVAKFGGQGDRTLITADFNKQFKTNKNLCRYFMLATKYFPNPLNETTKLLNRFSYLKPTALYLFKQNSS